MKVIAVIPCLNESQNVADLVLKSNSLIGHTIVADDGSDDGTAEKAQSAGAYVARHSGARGAGVNTKAGIDMALAMGADVVVTLDGDGQHDAEEMPKLIEPIIRGEADLVVGSRFLEKYEISRYRKFGIDVITLLYNIGSSTKVADSVSCFRAFRRSVAVSVQLEERGFGFSTEFLVKARALGFRIIEVPIKCIYHDEFSDNSSQNSVFMGVGIAWNTIRWRVRKEIMGF